MRSGTRIGTCVMAVWLAWQLPGVAQGGSQTTKPQGQGTAGQTGQAGQKAGQEAEGAINQADKKFVLLAGSAGMMEVEFGKLAAGQATNDAVKQFAQRMVDDHTKANAELMKIAEDKGIVLPKQMSEKDRAMHAKLSKMKGAAFDRAYMTHMVQDHKTDVTLFRRTSTNAADADVKAWAGKTLPVLEEHLQLATDTASKVGAKPGGAEHKHDTKK